MPALYDRIKWEEGMFEPPNSSDGTVYVHRENASQKINRKLKPGEVVHHIDENKKNNDPENLMVFRTTSDHTRFHSYVDHGISIDKFLVQNEDLSFTSNSVYVNVCECGQPKWYLAERCGECNSRWIARNIPPKEELEEIIWTMPTTKIAEKYGVSDKAVTKWCKKYNLSKPPRGYWAKIRSI